MGMGGSGSVEEEVMRPRSELVFMGTGSSSGVPVPRCLLPKPGWENEAAEAAAARAEVVEAPAGECRPDFPPQPDRDFRRQPLVSMTAGGTGARNASGVPGRNRFVPVGGCDVCESAVAGPPHECPNYRLNPSLLIRYRHVDEATGRVMTSTYQIDAGKTFREAALRWYPRFGIACLDALILTHEHADACFGLDDIRGFQVGAPGPLPVYCAQRDLDSLERRFDYLMPNFMKDQAVKRWVSNLQFNVIEPLKEFVLPGGLRVLPVMVLHGEDYECMGFVFGEHERVVYLSDVSRIPPETDAVLRGHAPPLNGNHAVGLAAHGSDITNGEKKKKMKADDDDGTHETESQDEPFIDLLVLDCLFMHREHPTHFNFEQSMACIRSLRPRRALLVGMSHDFDYDRVNERLLKERDTLCAGVDVKMARDGLSFNIHL